MENPFSRFEARRIARDAERMRLHKRIVELNAEGEKDAVAVEQLKQIYPDGFPSASDSPVPDAVEAPPTPPPTAAEMQKMASDMTVKDMALLILREAHPNGLTASQIKGKAFLKFRKHINSNTLTVSLVRLKPKVKCEGRTWFYVREGVDRLINAVATGVPAKPEDYDNALIGGAAE